MIRTSNRREPHVPPDFKLVAKIALSVAAAACIGLLLLLHVLAEDKGAGYGNIITAYDMARQNLQPAILVFGLVMIVFASITTWLFALYTSFRVAGPLFRIARNLEQAIDQGQLVPIPIRKTDSLQREWAQFDASVEALRAHYAKLGQALDEVRSRVGNGAGDKAPLEQAIAHLKEGERNVLL